MAKDNLCDETRGDVLKARPKDGDAEAMLPRKQAADDRWRGRSRQRRRRQ